MKTKLAALSEFGPVLEPPAYYNKRQLAHYLNVSVRTIDALMRARKLPFIKLTKKLVRFPKADVDAYLAQHHRVNAIGE
jgi:excisionase family DNA binding protein